MKNILCRIAFFTLMLALARTQASDLQASAGFEATVESAEATSIKLHWPPQAGATSYDVSRDGVVVGTTVGTLGYFTEFDLPPMHSYTYDVVARAGGSAIAQSWPVPAQTTSVSPLRTHYHVLAIAFNPEQASLVTERVYLEHRIQFLALASLGSALIDLYKGGIVSSPTTPAVVPGTTMVDYPALVTRHDLPGMNGLSIVDLIERGDIDHVWVVKSPVDFYENALIGNRMIQGKGQVGPNTWIPLSVASSRSFFVNFYFPDERSWDAYAHMVEGIMTSISDGYPDIWPRNAWYTVYTNDRASYTTVQAQLNTWEVFRLTDGWNGAGSVQYASPGHANIGSSHFPPTTPRECADYCYFDKATWQRYVDSWADAWLEYPGPVFSELPRKINGYEFGAFNRYAEGDASYSAALVDSPELHPSFTFAAESYHQWWFGHLRHNWRYDASGRVANWWPFIYDFNRFDGASTTGYGVGEFPHVQWGYPPINGEYGTNEASADNWGYWHSQNGFSPGGKAATLASVLQSAPVRHVTNGGDTIFTGAFDSNRVLEVSVENAQYWDNLNVGRNDVFYPKSRNANWSVPGLAGIEVSIKLGTNPNLVVDTNPVIRLCQNDGTRIEYVPRKNAVYANLFLDPALKDSDGWYNFYIPAAGDATWEKNVIGYVEPGLSPADQLAARAQLEQRILNVLNYVEVSIRTTTTQTVPDDVVTFDVDGLRLLSR